MKLNSLGSALPPTPPMPPIPVDQSDFPPVLVMRPKIQTAPLVFASAHSGRHYSVDFVASARLDLRGLRRSEDGFVDELFAAAPSLGAPLVAAQFPRAFCDANREPWELDPTMFHDKLPLWVNTASPRVGAGLGTIARVVASGESIYRDKLTFAEAQARVATYWQPFHNALRGVIDETLKLFGHCVLVDCHSMPCLGQPGQQRAEIVLGDAHGTACAPRVIRRVEHVMTGLGYRVRRNDPYAGGYITRHYGRPREDVHALQFEICRSLYMDEKRIERLPCFGEVQERLTRLILAMIEGGTGLATD